MKTVMDAVNEFKGEWPYSDSIVMYYYAGTNGYGFYSKISKGFSAAGFTSECFNDLVSQLETNFGESSLKHLHIWQRELKSQEAHDINERFKELEMKNEIDWSKAPDDCNLAVVIKKGINSSYGPFVYESDHFDGYQYCVNSGVGPHMKEHGLIKRPEAQPVFTQAMADNGELPQVGMEYQTGSAGVYKCVHVGIQHGEIKVVGQGKRDIRLFYKHECKPIDQRTDKEKAIDEFIGEHLKGGIAFKVLISLAYDKWVGE